MPVMGGEEDSSGTGRSKEFEAGMGAKRYATYAGSIPPGYASDVSYGEGTPVSGPVHHYYTHDYGNAYYGGHPHYDSHPQDGSHYYGGTAGGYYTLHKGLGYRHKSSYTTVHKGPVKDKAYYGDIGHNAYYYGDHPAHTTHTTVHHVYHTAAEAVPIGGTVTHVAHHDYVDYGLDSNVHHSHGWYHPHRLGSADYLGDHWGSATASYNCDRDAANWYYEWDAIKKKHCCVAVGVGCPGTFRPAHVPLKKK